MQSLHLPADLQRAGLQAPRRRRAEVACLSRRGPASRGSSRQQVSTAQQQVTAPPHANGTARPAAKGLKRYQTKTGKSVFSTTRSVKFHVRYKCEFGQEVFLVGNCGALGDWDVMRGVQLVWSPGHIWEGAVELPAGMHIQYKYVVRNKDGSVVRWQEGANVSLELPGGHADALALDVEDSWSKDKQVKRILAAGTPVRFNIRVQVEFGQQLLVVGSCASLGAWNVDAAVRLNWQEGHIWEAAIDLPAGELVEYKYVVLNGDGSTDRWQPGDNLRMDVPLAQGYTGRRRGVLVLDTWAKGARKKRAPRSHGGLRHPSAAPSWRSTPYSSVPAGSQQQNADGSVSVHTAGPRFGAHGSLDSFDIDDSASALAARGYYSMMSPADSLAAASSIQDPDRPQHDPSVMQLWTDRPRFGPGSLQQQHQAHQDPWAAQQQPQATPAAGEGAPEVPRVFVPPPAAGAGPEAFARWQALQSVMAALQHSSELDHWTDDPSDPRMLAADRRLAALTASLGSDVPVVV